MTQEDTVRLLGKIEKRGPDECWPFTDALDGGYGVFWAQGKKVRAHRMMWEIENGPIAHGLSCLHKCDNPPCCNPAHLFIGTNVENMADKVAKGRQSKGEKHSKAKLPTAARGERHAQAKLKAEDVILIRELWGHGRTLVSLGEQFNVSHNAISHIVLRKNWRHI